MALVSIIACGTLAYRMWDENYGASTLASTDDAVPSSQWYNGLPTAFFTTIRNPDICYCGIISSLFEGSMYIFTFMWNPALKTENMYSEYDLPYGLIFSTFMVSCMAGSSFYSTQVETTKGEVMAVGLLAVAALAMALIAVSTSPTLTFLSMLVFQMTVGMYWPVMGTLKARLVPESNRAAIYNLFRIPVNFIVLFSLLTDLTPTQSFVLNAIMLSIATALMHRLMKRQEVRPTEETNESNVELNRCTREPLLDRSNDELEDTADVDTILPSPTSMLVSIESISSTVSAANPIDSVPHS